MRRCHRCCSDSGGNEPVFIRLKIVCGIYIVPEQRIQARKTTGDEGLVDTRGLVGAPVSSTLRLSFAFSFRPKSLVKSLSIQSLVSSSLSYSSWVGRRLHASRSWVT